MGSTQSSARCLLVQLLQGRPTTAASHLTLRARQGTHALLILRARFPVSPALCGSLPEAEVFIEGRGGFFVACNGVDDQGIEEGLTWWSDGVFLYGLKFRQLNFRPARKFVCKLPSLDPPLMLRVTPPPEYAVYVLTIGKHASGILVIHERPAMTW